MSDLRLDNNGSSESLQASWVSPEGGVDVFLVTLSAPGSAAQERRLPPNITHVLFESLTPGRSYQLCVRTTAGGQSSETRTSGKTGTCSGGFLQEHSASCSPVLLTDSCVFPVSSRFSPSAGDGSLHVAAQ